MPKKLLFIFISLIALPIAALAAINTSLPKISNPFDSLQVKIPGMSRFADSQIIKDGAETTLKVNWIAEYIMGVYNYAVSIIGVFAVLGIAIGGVIWLLAGGNPSRVSVGKDWIMSSLLGLTLALGSFIILNTISSDLVSFSGQNLLIIKDVDLDERTMTAGGGQLTGAYKGQPTFSRNINNFDDILRQMSARYNIECSLAKAIMIAESNGRPEAVSSVGAKGLMQLMPATFRSMNVGSDPFNPATNIEAGVKYLSLLRTTACNGRGSNEVCNTNNIDYIIAAYNGGPKANKASVTCKGLTAWQCTQNSGYQQTRDYVNKVRANHSYLIQQGWEC